MSSDLNGILPIDRLKDHYKHCIQLSATNKINQKNAFDLQLIDYMQDLVKGTEDGQIIFKIASSALDVGAKIYSNRVDRIHCEAQKMASSMMMAVDGDTSATIEDVSPDDSSDPEPKKKQAAKIKNIKTVVEDTCLIDGKLEKMVLGDPYLEGLTQDWDMSCPAALICYNPLTQPIGLLTIESTHLRKNYKVVTTDLMNIRDCFNHPISLMTKNTNCAQILRKNMNNQICPRLDKFLFNDSSTNIAGLSFDLKSGGLHEFNPDLYDNNSDDAFVDADVSLSPDNAPQGNDLIPELEKIGASNPTEYGYSVGYHRLLNTWAGPHAWKIAKAPQTIKKDAVRAKKRAKLEQQPIDFQEDLDPEREAQADKEIRHSADVIKKWKKPLLPQDHNLNEELIRSTLMHAFLRPEETYNCTKTSADLLKVVENDHDYSRTDEPATPGDLGGFDDSDDEFRADPVVDCFQVPLVQEADLEFAGENLIEQPYTVAQVNIPFAKIAKKMDVRRLKRVMWDLLSPFELKESPTSKESTRSELNHFSDLYSEIPEKVSSKMANDLSQPIAFVTLLHLANEKNLKLTPKEDLKDFIIEQD